MLVYHRTTAAAAQAIQAHGFLDGASGYGTPRAKAGVLFADVPLDIRAGAHGEALITVDLVGEARHSLEAYAWVDPDRRAAYVEWLIPAEFANRRAVILSVDVREPAAW